MTTAKPPSTTRDTSPADSTSTPRALVYSQPDGRFTGPAYDYIRASDALPNYDGIAAIADPLCKVKLFLPGSRFTYYVCAVTDYGGMLVLSGFCMSPSDPRFDGFEDAGLEEIAKARVLALPIERDLHFTPMRVSAIEAAVTQGKTP
jgi:hypothetical protein